MKNIDDMYGSKTTFHNMFSYAAFDDDNNIVKSNSNNEGWIRGLLTITYQFVDYNNKPTKMKGEQLELFLSGETVFDRMLE